MKIRTHIGFGLLFGTLFYYFLGFDFSFVLITGVAAFLPDIDWAMQFKWGLGNRHRTFGHNVWFMIAVALIGFLVFRNVLLLLGILLGVTSHLIADSLTVSGVYWLYPYGKDDNKFHTSGPFSMSDGNNRSREKIIQTLLFTLAGFLFIIKRISIDLFSIKGLIGLAVALYVGYIIMKIFDNMIAKMIRNLGL